MTKWLKTLIIGMCVLVLPAMSLGFQDGPWGEKKVDYVLSTVAPTATDAGYNVSTVWCDTTHDKFYLLIDNTPSAAIWQESSVVGGSPSFVTVDLTGVTDTNIPYMQGAGAGFGDSPLSRTDANTILFKSATGQAAKLDISADAGEDNSDKWRVQVADGGDVTLQTYTSGAWVTTTTWTNAGGLTTTGKVGIGTTNPGQKLEVAGSIYSNPTSGAGALFIKRYTDTNYHSIYGGDSGTGRSDTLIFNSSGAASEFLFKINTADKVIIDTSGNVGIGTITPDTCLHAKIDNATTNATTNVQTLTHTTSGTPTANIGTGLAFEVETAADNNEIVGVIEGIATGVSSGTEQGAVVIKTMNTGATASEALRIQNKTLVYANETVTCVSDAGTASPLVTLSLIVTDGDADVDEDTVSLANGTFTGQLKIFIYKTETDVGDTANVTPATASGFTKIVFDIPGEGCTMIWDGAGWAIVSNNGGIIS